MRIVFLGTGDIGLPTLRWLIAHPRHELAAVVTQPDKPVGRKLVLTPPQVKILALQHGIPVLQPERIRNFSTELRELKADVFVVVAYGQILPRAILDLPRLACLNLHASLLPKYRGASPIQAAIAAGDKETAMTVMHMDVGLDTGDVLLEVKLPIFPDETGGSLHDRLAELGPDALERALAALECDPAPRRAQDHAAATHTKKLTREDGVIDWNQPAEAIARRIRAFDPWPGTSTTFPMREGAKLLKLFPPVIITSLSGDPGEALADNSEFLTVACGHGALAFALVQMEGKRRMSAREFLAGHPISPGTRLGSPT